MADEIDRNILRALQCSPRASFRLIGEVAGVSEQTAARRFQALRRDGVVRVMGLVNPAVYGQAQWVARIRCRPDKVAPLADSLARRPDIAFANLTSGGSELICIIRAPVDVPHDHMLLRRLPQSGAVLDVSIDLLIHPFGDSTDSWSGYGGNLTPDQIELLTADRQTSTGPLLPLTGDDAPLLEALANDGRSAHTHLAELTGWSNARVGRRLDALEHSGTVYYDVDLLPERLGHHLNATLWIRVAPAHLERTGEELARHEEVAFAGATSGDHNIMAIVTCRDANDFYDYLTTKLAAIAGIDGYQVSIRVRRLKQAASLISHSRLIHPANS